MKNIKFFVRPSVYLIGILIGRMPYSVVTKKGTYRRLYDLPFPIDKYIYNIQFCLMGSSTLLNFDAIKTAFLKRETQTFLKGVSTTFSLALVLMCPSI